MATIDTNTAAPRIAFGGNCFFYGFLATLFLAPPFFLIYGQVVLLLTGQPAWGGRGDMGSTEAALGLAAFLLLLDLFVWRAFFIYRTPCVQLRREGVILDLRRARAKESIKLLFTKFSGHVAWIPWDRLRLVEARSNICEYDYRYGILGGLVLEGDVFSIGQQNPQPSQRLFHSIAICGNAFDTVPYQVASMIEPFLADAELREMLPTLADA